MKLPVSAFILLAVAILNILDVYGDMKLNVPLHHILEETIVIIASGACGIYLLWAIRTRSKALLNTKSELQQANAQVSRLSSKMAEARHQFANSIREQFCEWNLSTREQELGFLLIKGLSFKEIAVVMDSKEKTLRQQASSIYSKSGLDGRHALAAWFLEDFLTPQTDSGPTEK